MTGTASIPPALLALLGWLLVLSAAAFAVYGVDKSAARRGSRRVPENTLHLLGVLGGWPGALAAQRVFRHKTQKPAFRRVFWCTVAVNCAALAWILAGMPGL